MAEVEGEEDRLGLLSALSNLPNIPKAIVTNLPFKRNGYYDPALTAEIRAAGFECLTEVYLGSNGQATPEALDNVARQCGWQRTHPCFGIWNKPLEEYQQWMNWPGWSIYLAEYLN